MVTNTVTPEARLNERLLLELARRRAAGTPQWLIAAQAKVNPTLLSLWVYGRRQPTTDEASRVAEVLGIEVADIWPQLASGHGREGNR